MPILATRTVRWDDEADCAAMASRLAGVPSARVATVELHGPLGAGKTTFVRHLLRALGVHGPVKSPTYAVMEPYLLPGGGSAAHFDFYRFDDPQEWEDAGFRDVYAGPGLKIAEWPERVGALLPTPDLALTIAPADGVGPSAAADDDGDPDGAPCAARLVRLDAWSSVGTALLDAALLDAG